MSSINDLIDRMDGVEPQPTAKPEPGMERFLEAMAILYAREAANELYPCKLRRNRGSCAECDPKRDETAAIIAHAIEQATAELKKERDTIAIQAFENFRLYEGSQAYLSKAVDRAEAAEHAIDLAMEAGIAFGRDEYRRIVRATYVGKVKARHE